MNGSALRMGVVVSIALAVVVGVPTATAIAADPAPTTTTITATPNPVQIARPVTLTATVRGGTSTPTGTVTFIDYSTEEQVGKVRLDGQGVATLTTGNLIPPLTHRIMATYDGDPTHAVNSTARYPLQIDPAPPGNTHAYGGDMLLLNGTPTRFDLDLYSNGTAAAGFCQLGNDRSFYIACIGFSDFRRSGNTITFRGTGLYNRQQPISFTAQVVDGSPDSFTIYGAGQKYGGTVSNGDIVIGDN